MSCDNRLKRFITEYCYIPIRILCQERLLIFTESRVYFILVEKMAIQEVDGRLLAQEDLEPIKIASPADAGFEIALHFYSFVDGEEPAFHLKWFSLDYQHHVEIEAQLLRELDIPPESVNRTEEKQCLKTVGNIGLFSWSDVDPETGRAHGVYYAAEPVEIRQPS